MTKFCKIFHFFTKFDKTLNFALISNTCSYNITVNMTTVCHNKSIYAKKLKIMYFFVIIFSMKRYINIFIVIILLFSLFISPQINFVFADENAESPITIVNNEIDDEYEKMSIFSNEILLCSKNGKIFNVKSLSIFENSDLETGIYIPTFAEKISQNKISIFDSLNRIQQYNGNYEYLATLKYVSSDNPYNLGEVIDVTKDYSGNLYFIDYTKQKILKLENDNSKIEEININLNFAILKNYKISVNPNGNLMAISTDENIYVYNLTNLELLNTIHDSSNFVLFDYLNNLFAIKKGESNFSFKKFLSNNYSFDSSKQIDKALKDICIDMETGKFYFLSDALYSYYEDGFSANASYETPPVDISTTTLLPSEVTYAKVIAPTKLFSTCVSISSSVDLNINQSIIVLKQDISQNETMCFCLANVEGEQKLGYVQKTDIEVLEIPHSQMQYKTIYSNVEVLTYPTYSAGTNRIIENENSCLIIVDTANNFVDEKGNSYYTVIFDDGIGYINQNALQNQDNFESIQIDIITTPDNSTQFMAYALVVASLFILIIIVCMFIAKKKY